MGFLSLQFFHEWAHNKQFSERLVAACQSMFPNLRSLPNHIHYGDSKLPRSFKLGSFSSLYNLSAESIFAAKIIKIV